MPVVNPTAPGVITSPGMSFAENSTGTNVSVYVDAMTATAATTDGDIALVTKGGGALIRQVPDGTTAGGDKRGLNAVDFQSAVRSLSTAVASGLRSTILNGSGTATASGSDSLVLNGSGKAVGNSSIAGQAGTANSNFTIAVGASNTGVAGGATYSVNFGGLLNGATYIPGAQSGAWGGSGNHGTGSLATAVGGSNNLAGGYGSLACGISGVTTSRAQFALGAGTTMLVSQLSIWPLRAQTTGTAGVTLTSDGLAAGTTNQVILADAQAILMDVLLVGHTAGTAAFGRRFSCLVRRGVGAASTAIVGQSTLWSVGDASLSSCTVVLSADTTNGGLSIVATGVAATTINWTASCSAAHGS